MKVRKGSLSDVLLLTLEKTVNGMLYLENFTYSGQMRNVHGIPYKPNQALVMAIRRLRTKGFIEHEKDQEGKILLKLTNLGKEFLKEENNDKYTVIIWDIPETKRTVRNLLRRRIKDWGFRSWQKSVYVSKKNVAESLRNLILELGVGKWVAVIESNDPSLEFIFK